MHTHQQNKHMYMCLRIDMGHVGILICILRVRLSLGMTTAIHHGPPGSSDPETDAAGPRLAVEVEHNEFEELIDVL